MNHINDPLSGLEYDVALLRQFYPLKELSFEDQQQMARKSRLVDVGPGDELKATEEHRWILYLLGGQVNSFSRDQTAQLISASSAQACHPLFSEKSAGAHLVALSQCKVVRFDRQLFETLLSDSIMSGGELETLEVSEVEGTLFNEIMHAFNMGQLQLPSLPEVALKVKSAASRADVSVDDIVLIVEADPAMAARLIQVANSPLNGSYDSVRGIKGAIVRLGLANTRELVVSLSIKQLFKSQSPLLKHRMQAFYQHSVDIAAISYSIATISKQMDPDHALLAGLVHDIGIIPILSYIEQTGLTVADETELQDIIEKLRAVVGCLIIKQWGLAADLVTAIENAENWHREEAGKLDASDVLIVAHIYNCLQHKNVQQLPDISQVAAFKKLYSETISTEFAQQVLVQSQQQINEIKRLLKL